MAIMASQTGEKPVPDNTDFDQVAAFMQGRFAEAVGSGRPLFRIKLDDPDTDLFQVFLGALPEGERQHHTCNCCKAFFRRYANLVTLDERGRGISPLFGASGPGFYGPALAALEAEVTAAGSEIEAVFVSSEAVWGTPISDGWTHFHVRPPVALVWKRRDLTAFQRQAALTEDFRTLKAAIVTWKRTSLVEAVRLLKEGQLARSEKVVGHAEWLLNLFDKVNGAKVYSPAQRDRLLWAAVAVAPAGWCAPRSGMLGSLLDDLEGGMDFAAVKSRFDKKMDPLLYLRPQAAPSAGTLAQAEKLVAQMGIERSLARRFARLDEVKLIWQPAPASPVPPRGPVFGHLKAKEEPPAWQGRTTPPVAMTWAKFVSTVLPDALSMEVLTEHLMELRGSVTAVHADAPPILQWDMEEERNPVSTYVYVGGSPPSAWSLPTNAWIKVTGIMLDPSLWGSNPLPNHGKRATLVLEGAKDPRHSGLALFPETLKSALHPVRSVIEAHSRSRHIEGREDASANGVTVPGRSQIRVTTKLGQSTYLIDRWD